MDTTIHSIATGLGEICDTSVTQQHKPGESLYFNSIQRTQPNIVAHALTCLPNIGACKGDFVMGDSVVRDFVMGDFVILNFWDS